MALRVYRLQSRETGAGIFCAGVAPDEWRALIPPPRTDCRAVYYDLHDAALFGFTERQVKAMLRKSTLAILRERTVTAYDGPVRSTRTAWRTFIRATEVAIYSVPLSRVIACTHHQVVFHVGFSTLLDTIPLSHYLPSRLLAPPTHHTAPKSLRCDMNRR